MMTNEDSEPKFTYEELRTAVEDRQFSVCYQPKLDCADLALKGFEALIRWDHPEKGSIMPGEFIPMAEQTGMIGAITEQVVHQAFFWYSGTSGVSGLTLAINFSAKRLGDKDFPDWLQGVCRRAGMRTDSVIIEVSESAVLGARLNALDMFTGLTSKGFKVSIDDFGTAQSTLQSLGRLPFSEVKIDRSYGMSAKRRPESRAFLKSTIELAHNMSLHVAAEGVEDRETLDYLREVRCDFAMGYLISKPMTGDEAHEWIVNRRKMIRHILV